MMLIGDQIGDVPGQEIERLSGEVTRFVSSNSRLHVQFVYVSAEAYTRPVVFLQEPLGGWRSYS